MSGRVPDTTQNTNFKLYDTYSENKPVNNYQNEAIKGIHTTNPLSDIYFSRVNIDALQEAIRYQVYLKSCKKHIIGKQSENELLIIMRGIYLEYKRHLDDVLQEVRYLNMKVLEYSVPKILEEIKMYLYYRKDISQLPIPLDRAQFVSSKGTKTLEQKF